jgi:hypothetical protein
MNIIYFLHPEAQGVVVFMKKRSVFVQRWNGDACIYAALFKRVPVEFSIFPGALSLSQQVTARNIFPGIKIDTLCCVSVVAEKRDKLRQSNDKNPFISEPICTATSLSLSSARH